MSEQAQLTFPVLGMTCATCVATVERNSIKVEGVTDATVNFASEKVTVTYDPAVADAKVITSNVIERVKKAGYEIPKATLALPLIGMTCADCANTIERRLNKVDGVLEATVNFASEKASVTYVPGAVKRAELVAAVRLSVYDVAEVVEDEELEDAEIMWESGRSAWILMEEGLDGGTIWRSPIGEEYARVTSSGRILIEPAH